MLFKSLVKASIVASALASPIQHHQHHQHEKKAVVTHTVVVTVGSGPEATPLSSASVENLNAVSGPAPPVVTGSSSVIGSGSGTTSSSVPASTASSSAAAAPSESSSSSFSGAAKGITYSPYNADGTCKSASAVASDIAKLKDFEIIRLYGVDCAQVENVLPALADGQKIFAGIFFVNDIAGGISTLASAVKANGGWDLVHTVSIGNELVNNGEATVSQVKSYIQEGKSALTAAGYTGPVVSIDTFIAVINNPGLCDLSDYMAVNAHAFFDGYVTAEEAGDWVLLQIERVASTCTSKKVFITETGWPTKGNNNNVAVPSVSNQESALSSISDKCGNDVLFFNAYNDYWKSDGAWGVEKYWGIFSS